MCVESMDAIVFASFVPTIESLSIAKEYLDIIKDKFSDCDVYVGINYGTIPEWKTILDEYSDFLSIKYSFVGKELNIDSDASAYQLALKIMSDSKKSYKLVWFMHTKGVTKDRDYIRNILFNEFLSQRETITEKFLSHKEIGNYGRYITSTTSFGYVDKALEDIFTFSHTSTNTFFLYSFYVIRGEIIKKFLEGVDRKFFSKNLVSDLGYNRYFFESVFPAISDKFGYRPQYGSIINHPYRNIINKGIIEYMIKNRNISSIFYGVLRCKNLIGRYFHITVEYIMFTLLPKNAYSSFLDIIKRCFVKIGIIQKDF